MRKSYSNKITLQKLKLKLKKTISFNFPSKKKLRGNLHVETLDTKQLSIVKGVTSSSHFRKTYTFNNKPVFTYKKRLYRQTILKLKRKILKAKKRRVITPLGKLPRGVKNYQRVIINMYKRQKDIRAVRLMLKSQLPRLFFEPWKKTKSRWTEKQKWLHVAYNKYRFLRLKDRVDFFRTYIGKLFLETELASHRYPQSNFCWLSERKLRSKLQKEFNNKLQSSNKKNKQYLNRILTLYTSRMYLNSKIRVRRHYLYLINIHRRGWWYENLIQKRKKPLSAKAFLLEKPKTAFQSHWKQQKREPWKDALLFKRALYSGFGEIMRKENKFGPLKMRFYLRHKNPRHEKRNRLYQRNSKLLANFRQRNRIRVDKAARIKQIAGKILRPFYGHLRFKQMTKLVKKSRRVKSNSISRNEILLNHLENRLDVVVYRLNFAPTILWARRLILGGSIFVTNLKKTHLWDLMYSSLKKFAFPLKLRDPKKLYSQTLWKPHRQLAQYKFLGEPKKKISYLVQPEDIIQCSGGVLMNHFRSDSLLLQKPIPSHLFTLPKNKIFWTMRFQQFERTSFQEWEQVTDTVKSAIFLHPAQFDDLNPHDRVQESFFRWAIL